MAMSYLIRKAPSSVVLINHSLRPRFLSSRSIITHVNKDNSHQFSSMKKLVDQNFVKLLNSEIEYFNRNVPTKPIDFPFEEDPHKYFNTFTRELPGETIQVQLMRNDFIGWMLEDFQVTVTIYKDEATIELKFTAPADEIIVKTLTIDFRPETYTYKLENTSADIQYCLTKYLEMRGINRSNVEFLRKYCSRCKERDEMKCLNGLKNFLMN